MSQAPPPHQHPPYPQQPPPGYRPPPPPPQGGMSGGTIALIVSLVVGIPLALMVVALLIGIMLPALGAARRTARRMQNSTQLRGYHQGMITFSRNNNQQYPGLNTQGEVLANSAMDTGNSGDGDTVEARYWIMLDGNFITAEYAISPSETDAKTEYLSGPVDDSNYSFALLSIEGSPGHAPRATDRAQEWADVISSQAVVASDRNTGTNATTGIQSIHVNRPGEWKGSVLWNDNHVAFEMEPILETRYGNGVLNVDAMGQPNDNLFAPAGDADAWMIHAGD